MNTATAQNDGAEVLVEKRMAFASVPDLLLEDCRLSLAARLVCGWMLGRAPGWTIRLGHMQRVLGVSDKIWRGVRKELIEHGYYVWDKKQGVSKKGKKGVWIWTHRVTDAPLFELMAEKKKKSIPPFCTDGESAAPSIPPARTDGPRTDAASTDARGGDIPDEVNTSVNTSVHKSKPPNQNRPADAGPPAAASGATAMAPAGAGAGGGDVVEMSEEEKEHLAAALWQQDGAGKPVSNEGGFRTVLLKRWRRDGFNARDMQTVAAWRLATVADPDAEIDAAARNADLIAAAGGRNVMSLGEAWRLTQQVNQEKKLAARGES